MLTEQELFHIMQGLRLLGMNLSNMKEEILQMGDGYIMEVEQQVEDLYYKIEGMYNESISGKGH